jgi:hypothetical protein
VTSHRLNPLLSRTVSATIVGCTARTSANTAPILQDEIEATRRAIAQIPKRPIAADNSRTVRTGSPPRMNGPRARYAFRFPR